MRIGRLAASAIAIGLFAVPGVAAERLSPPAQRLDGLKVCPDGGFALSGSNTCVRLSGTIEADTVLLASPKRGPPAAGRGFAVRDHVRSRIAVDVRTPTDFGPVRLYTSVRVNAAPEPDVLRR